MPSFRDSAVSRAPPEEVWKLLYDPARFPEWWAGMATVDAREREEGGARRFTYFAEGWPDFPMPQLLSSSGDDRRVIVSCLVSDLRFDWQLEALAGGRATRITVYVDIPEPEAKRLDTQRDVITRSLARLAALAADLPR
jgi:Polyketide cyclase / dehydrase and lipid transport